MSPSRTPHLLPSAVLAGLILAVLAWPQVAPAASSAGPSDPAALDAAAAREAAIRAERNGGESGKRSRRRDKRGSALPAVGGVEYSLSARRLKNEPGTDVVVVPGDPTRVAASARQPKQGSPRIWVSNDSMAPKSAVDARLPGQALLPTDLGGGTKRFNACCEPALAADEAGNFWHATATRSSKGRILINRVPAGGFEYQGLSVAMARRTTGAQTLPVLAIDNSPTSPKRGRIYLVWTELDGADQNIVLSECDSRPGGSPDPSACDDPDNWTAAASIPAINDAPGQRRAPDAAVAPNGDLYVTWWNADSPGVAGNRIEVDTCAAASDCTSQASWGGDANLANLDAIDDDGDTIVDPLPVKCPIITAPAGLVGPQPQIEVGPDGTVAVVWSDLRSNSGASPDPTRCGARGLDETWDSYIAIGAAPGAIPATDTGARLSDDGAAAANDHFQPALTIDPTSGEIEVSLYSTKNFPDGRSTFVYAVTSDDGFSSMTRISQRGSSFSGSISDGLDYGRRQGSDSAGGVFYPVWSDNRARQDRDTDLYVFAVGLDSTLLNGPSGTVPNSITTLNFEGPTRFFACSLDGESVKGCESPFRATKLLDGPHSFEVVATDRFGNPIDPTPATAAWIVDDTDRPQTRISQGPRGITRSKRPAFRFRSDEPGSSFECRFGQREWQACSSPFARKVKVGPSTFKVRATDVNGNTDVSPARRKFKRKSTR